MHRRHKIGNFTAHMVTKVSCSTEEKTLRALATLSDVTTYFGDETVSRKNSSNVDSNEFCSVDANTAFSATNKSCI